MVSVMLYPYIFSIDLSIDLFSLCGACLTVFDETICNIFLDEVVIECYGSDECVWRCSIGYTVYGLPKNVCVVSVIPVCI